MSELGQDPGPGATSASQAGLRPERTARGGAASGAKIVVAGLAIGAGLTIAGTMAATAQMAQSNESPQTYTQRVVIVPEDTTQPQLAAIVANDSRRNEALLAAAAPHPALGASVPQAESEAS